MYKFIQLEKKNGKVVETVIAQWDLTKNPNYATNYAEGYIDAMIQFRKGTTIHWPCWKNVDGYVWWNHYHTMYWVVVNGKNHIVAPSSKKEKYSYKKIVKQMESED